MLQDQRTDKPAQNWLLAYLPEIYQSVELIGGFLRVFESVWESFDWQIDHLDTYFDPDLTQATFLPWLSTWVGLALDENLKEEQQRELLGKAMWLYKRQGTAAALHEMLRIYVPTKQIEIQNHSDIGQIAPYHFRVTVHMPDDATTDSQERKQIKERVKRIIDTEKPAHTWYDLAVKWP